MIESKYGFSVGEKVLWTSEINGGTEICTIVSFDPYPKQGKGIATDVGWDEVKKFSKIQPCDGNQLLFDFMYD